MTTKYTCSNCCIYFHPDNTKYTRLLFHFSPEDILFNALKKDNSKKDRSHTDSLPTCINQTFYLKFKGFDFF